WHWLRLSYGQPIY
nr:mating factor alpha [Kazachstania exigua]